MKDAINTLHELPSSIPTPTTAASPPPMLGPMWYEEDSISLIDLWLELAKYRALIFGSIALTLVIGLLVAFLLPEKYNYTTSIEIGYSTNQTGKVLERTPIDNPQTVLAKLTTNYIPQARQHYATQYPQDIAPPEIKVRIPKGSQLIILESKGPEDKAKIFIALLQAALDKLFMDHQRVTDLARADLQTSIDKAGLVLAERQDPRSLQVDIDEFTRKLNNARVNHDELHDPRVLKGLQKETLEMLQKAGMKLKKLRDPRFFAATKQEVETKLSRTNKRLIDLRGQAALITSRYQRTDKTDDLLKKQIGELVTQINAALQARHQALEGLQTEASAMTMLMIDNEIQQNRLRLATLEERLYIQQQDLRQTLEDRLAANQREQSVQQQLFTQLQDELNRLTLENTYQQTQQLNHIEQLNGDLERQTLRNQRAQQLAAPHIAQLEAQLAKLQADHQRKLIAAQQDVNLLKSRLQGLTKTRALSPPMQSLKPTGPSKILIMALTLVLGLLIGVFAAFFASFLSKVRQHKELPLIT